MKPKHIPVKTLFLLVGAGAVISMLALSAVLSIMTHDIWVLIGGGLLTVCALMGKRKRRVPQPRDGAEYTPM